MYHTIRTSPEGNWHTIRLNRMRVASLTHTMSVLHRLGVFDAKDIFLVDRLILFARTLDQLVYGYTEYTNGTIGRRSWAFYDNTGRCIQEITVP